MYTYKHHIYIYIYIYIYVCVCACVSIYVIYMYVCVYAKKPHTDTAPLYYTIYCGSTNGHYSITGVTSGM